MKFLVDMPVTPQAVAHLHAQGHDAVHAFAVGLSAKPDTEILERARAEERIVITADLDYPRLLAQLKADRPGVILFRGGSYSDAEMLALLACSLSPTRWTWRARSQSSISTGSAAAAFPSRIDALTGVAPMTGTRQLRA